MQHQQREGAVQPCDHIAQRLGEIAGGTVLEAHEQGRDLAVGFAREDEIRVLLEQLLLELGEILDDAVVDERELAVVSEVRMRVLVVRATVRRPPRVPDAGATVRDADGGEVVDEHLELAGPLTRGEFAILVDHGDPRRVIPAVFQSTEAAQQHLDALVGSDIAHDSAHRDRF